jgi:hypothetical protein
MNKEIQGEFINIVKKFKLDFGRFKYIILSTPRRSFKNNFKLKGISSILLTILQNCC